MKTKLQEVITRYCLDISLQIFYLKKEINQINKITNYINDHGNIKLSHDFNKVPLTVRNYLKLFRHGAIVTKRGPLSVENTTDNIVQQELQLFNFTIFWILVDQVQMRKSSFSFQSPVFEKNEFRKDCIFSILEMFSANSSYRVAIETKTLICLNNDRTEKDT